MPNGPKLKKNCKKNTRKSETKNFKTAKSDS